MKRQKQALLNHLKREGFSENILSSFAAVRRESFILESQQAIAYQDIALPIGFGQTISQPSTIAFMLALLEVKDGQRILEVGSGSGYVLALLGQLVKRGEVFGVEIIRELADLARKRLKNNRNIKIIYASKDLGLPQKAPFDRILVSAAARKMPQKLVWQLKTEGIMVCPVQNAIWQVKKSGKGLKIRKFPGFAFVPLMG